METTEDKIQWCKSGYEKELAFLQERKSFLKRYPLILNPEKKHNVYAADFWNTRSSRPEDLKSQETPFFKSQILYGIPPNHAITVNVFDMWSYEQKYGGIWVTFLVMWKEKARMTIGNMEYSVEPHEGIYRALSSDILSAILSRDIPIHIYGRRKSEICSIEESKERTLDIIRGRDFSKKNFLFDDNGNKRCSAVLDFVGSIYGPEKVNL